MNAVAIKDKLTKFKKGEGSTKNQGQGLYKVRCT